MADQLTLFPAAAAGPQGLQYFPDFVSADTEQELIAHIRALPLQPFQFGAFEGKRRVASFGWRYDYSEQRLLRAETLPDWIAREIPRVEAFGGLLAGAIRQVLFTEYEAGAGIGWHRDKPHLRGGVRALALFGAQIQIFAAGR